MAVSQSDLDNLNAAIASGVRSTTLGGQTVTYGTIDALIKARDDIAQQIAALAPAPRRRNQTYLYQSGRGYDRDCG